MSTCADFRNHLRLMWGNPKFWLKKKRMIALDSMYEKCPPADKSAIFTEVTGIGRLNAEVRFQAKSYQHPHYEMDIPYLQISVRHPKTPVQVGHDFT